MISHNICDWLCLFIESWRCIIVMIMLGWGSHDLDFIYLYHSCKWSQCYIQFIDLLYIREHRTGLSWWKTLVMPSFILYLQNCIFSKCSKSMTCWKCIQCRHWSVNQDCRKSFFLLFYFFYLFVHFIWRNLSCNFV